MKGLWQHQRELEQNYSFWKAKPLLQAIYGGFYKRILALIDGTVPGRIVEIGSGIGNLKEYLPRTVATDLFPNPWLDIVCDGYELPFRDGTISHLILFDVFHHLEAPNAFLSGARRVLNQNGRVILFEPYIGWSSFAVYGLAHHEPIGWRKPINTAEQLAQPRRYYAAQGNATRLFFRREVPNWPRGWKVFHAEAITCFHYLLSGGFSKPSLYPKCFLQPIKAVDQVLSRWPNLFAGRCLIGLQRAESNQPP